MKDYELLEKQAAMMRMAEKYGVGDWRKLVRVKFRSGDGDIGRYSTITPYMNASNEHQFALGVIEGNAVFEGNTLYVGTAMATIRFTEEVDGKVIYRSNIGSFYEYQLTWNPPAPKTVMVELFYDDARSWSKSGGPDTHDCAFVRLHSACRKALEGLK